MPNQHSPVQQSPNAALILKYQNKLQQFSYNKKMDTSLEAPAASAVDAPASATSATAALETPKQAGKRVRFNSPETQDTSASSQTVAANLPEIDISDIPNLSQEEMMRR